MEGTQNLAGKRVLITRASGQDQGFGERLRARGAMPVELPTVKIVPTADKEPVHAAIDNLATYHWIVFTSANGVRHFLNDIAGCAYPDKTLERNRVAVIGPSSAAELEKCGIHIDIMPEEHIAERLINALGDVAGQRVLIPTADIARDILTNGLRDAGAVVDRVTVYQTLPASRPDDLDEILPALHFLTFTSSSTVTNFVVWLQTDQPDVAIGSAVVAVIGPATAKTARELGLPVHVVSAKYTIPGLIEAMETFLCGRGENASH